MRRSTKLWVLAAVTVVLVGAGGYVYAEYRFSQRPSSLASIPEYPYGTGPDSLIGSSYPINDLTSQERKYAETTLHQFVSTIVAGYHITGQRFLAGKSGGFEWDAIRSEVGGYLHNTFSSYRIETNGSTPEAELDIAYIVWRRTSRLQQLFNDNIIVAAGFPHPIRPAPAAGQIYVYGYFELAPN